MEIDDLIWRSDGFRERERGLKYTKYTYGLMNRLNRSAPDEKFVCYLKIICRQTDCSVAYCIAKGYIYCNNS